MWVLRRWVGAKCAAPFRADCSRLRSFTACDVGGPTAEVGITSVSSPEVLVMVITSKSHSPPPISTSGVESGAHCRLRDSNALVSEPSDGDDDLPGEDGVE